MKRVVTKREDLRRGKGIRAKALAQKKRMDDRRWFYEGYTPCQQYVAVIRGELK